MREFDLSKPWIILAAASEADTGHPIEKKAAQELALWLGKLRSQPPAELGDAPVPVLASDGPAPEEDAPIIVLNAGNASDGFSWRVGETRVEIYGDSPKGLLNGVYDFLGALGFAWERAGEPRFPVCKDDSASTVFQLSRSGAYEKVGRDDRKVLTEEKKGAPRLERIALAARNKADAVHFRSVVSPEEYAEARSFGIEVELDGPSAQTLIPRAFFLFKRDLFRMESGRRTCDHNFCPTNPDSIQLAAKRAVRFFRRRPRADVFILKPDSPAHGNAWCACPTCRAFSPAEQRLMAANSVADALAETAPAARLILRLETPENESLFVEPRPNLLIIREIPS